MQTLKSLSFIPLNETALKLLQQNRIITILDFLQEDVTKLAALIKLNLPEVLAIRNEIFEKYSAPITTCNILLKKLLSTRRHIKSGIESLDIITDGGIPIGYITEICGLAESGKTQLSFQLAINCVKCAEDTVLYVDAKGDFSAIRLQKMLQAQQCSYREMAQILHKIRIVHIWTMDELVALFKSIKNKTLVMENLSLIIVDSLLCLMLQHLGDENKIGLSYLNTVVNYSRFIGNEFNVGIIFINIQTRWIDSDNCDIEDYGESASTLKEPIFIEKRNRCLGRYWAQVPALVLLLEKLDINPKDINVTSVKVSVLSSNNIKSLNNECIVNINARGVV